MLVSGHHLGSCAAGSMEDVAASSAKLFVPCENCWRTSLDPVTWRSLAKECERYLLTPAHQTHVTPNTVRKCSETLPPAIIRQLAEGVLGLLGYLYRHMREIWDYGS